MAEHAPGVDMMAQAEIVELKGKVRDYEKELKEQEKKLEKQEKEIDRLKQVAGRSYGMGAVWLTAIIGLIIGAGAATAFFIFS